MSKPLPSFSLLDQGYLTVIETWGSDRRIVEAARMSTDKGFLGWGQPGYFLCDNCGYECQKDIVALTMDERVQCCSRPNLVQQPATSGDEKLLNYLWTHEHKTPFEMAGAIVEVQAPIMVFREWHRHRTMSYNELSARYTMLPAFDYMPTVERLMVNSKGNNKQANRIDGAPELTEHAARHWLMMLGNLYNEAQMVYETGLQMGVPKELARLAVTVARYSRMRASANLRNWLAFITLRSSQDAQYEIRQYSNAMQNVISHVWPRTFALMTRPTK